MANWQPILHGCFSSKGRAYGYDLAPPRRHLVMQQLVDARVQGTCWFIGRTASDVCFGLRDEVGAQLGWDYPLARDQGGRRLEFMLAYAADIGTTLPSFDALGALKDRARLDLRKFGDLARQAGRVLQETEQITLPDFQPQPNPSTAWEQAVLDVAGGRRPWVILGFNEAAGPVASLGPLPHKPNAPASSLAHAGSPMHSPRRNDERADDELGQSMHGKKNSSVSRTKAKRILLLIAVLLIGMLALGLTLA